MASAPPFTARTSWPRRVRERTMPSRRASWSSATRMRAMRGGSLTGSGPGHRRRAPPKARPRRADGLPAAIRDLCDAEGWLRIKDGRSADQVTSMNRKTAGFNLAYVLIAALGVMALQDWWVRSQAVATLPYSEFQKLVREDKVARVLVAQDQVTGELKEPLNGKTKFVTVRVDADMAKELDQHGVTYAGRFQNELVPMILSWVLPIGLFLGVWVFLGRRMAKQLGGGAGGGLMAIGKSKAKVYVETDTKVTFADVAGVDEAKDELKEVVAFLKDPKSYGGLGARMPKGVLLVGPPGTGKTLLAKAVAGEAGVPFFSISGSEFVEMFVGVGAARVRDLFEQAKRNSPCIVFVDEIDAVGRQRGAGLGGGHDEREQTLNQILVEMDGFDNETNVIVIAATNRPDVLDPALLRPGRFDRKVVLDRPDLKDRKAILNIHAKEKPLEPDIDLKVIAARTAS